MMVLTFKRPRDVPSAAVVRTASPVSQRSREPGNGFGSRLRRSFSSSPPAAVIAPSPPAPPRQPRFAALTMQSPSYFVMSPWPTWVEINH